MKILVIGGGGREHAIVWKLAQNPNIEKIFCAPGNAGTGEVKICENVDIMANDIAGLLSFAKENSIDFTVVGPDEPIVLGIVDVFLDEGLRVFGPRKNAAVLEGSKSFSKKLMKKYGIPTASYEVFNDYEGAVDYINNIKNFTKPIVIKADGLALGKGVTICENVEKAKKVLYEIFINKKFGASGDSVIIEEYLQGEEASVLAFCDGKTIVPMIAARDHKRALDNDEGENTGGMGTITPISAYNAEVAKYCMQNIFQATLDALNGEGIEYKGIIFFGLMLSEERATVIEYNARFGDPEAQVVLPLLENDLLEVMIACTEGRLNEIDLKFKNESAACVIIASEGYPQGYKKGIPITGINEANKRENTIVFSAGTKKTDNVIVTNGGRVIGVTGLGETLEQAIKTAYDGVSEIHFDNMHYRKDIGSKI